MIRKMLALVMAVTLIAVPALAELVHKDATPVDPNDTRCSFFLYDRAANQWRCASAGANGEVIVQEALPTSEIWDSEVVFADSISNYVHTADSTHTCIETSGFHTLMFTFNEFCRAAQDSVMYLGIEFLACNTAAGNAVQDTAVTFHMQAVNLRPRKPAELYGYQSQDTIGHPVQPVASFDARKSVLGAANVIPSTGNEVIVALRGDPDFAKMGPANSPKGFAIIVNNWWSPYLRMKVRVLNVAFTGSGADKPANMNDPKWRWCQLAATCNKSAL